MNILVLAGGYSPERNVSLCTGAMVTEALRSIGHKVALIDSYVGVSDSDRELEKLYTRPIPKEWEKVAVGEPDLIKLKRDNPQNGNSLLGKNVFLLCSQVDVVFLALHGGSGEDGHIQAALDMLGIHYTGSDYFGSALAMNKDMTKIIVQSVGVRVPAWETAVYETPADVERTLDKIPLPIVVKVPNGGSSIGVFIAHSKDELKKVLYDKIGRKLILEQYIDGREIQMAFLGDRALPSIEITIDKVFFDYTSKYQIGQTVEQSPADITPAQEQEMSSMLMKVAKALNLKAYSRADFIIDKNNKIWFIEINTLPGLTRTSLLPQEAAVAGIPFVEVCDYIVKQALIAKVGTM